MHVVGPHSGRRLPNGSTAGSPAYMPRSWRSLPLAVLLSLLTLLPLAPSAAGAALRELSVTRDASGLVRASGRLTGGDAAWKVTLQQRAASGWTRVARPLRPTAGRFFLSWRPTSTATLRVRVVAIKNGRVRLKGRSLQLALQPTSQPGASAPGAAATGATPGGDTTAPGSGSTTGGSNPPPDPAPTPEPTDTFDGGELQPGQSLTDEDGRYLAYMQHDGNFVIYVRRTGEAVWATGTAGYPGARLVEEAGGNFAVKLGGQTLWQTDTSWYPGTKMTLNIYGDLIVTANSRVIWTRHRGYVGDTLRVGERVFAGQRMRSRDGTAIAIMDSQGRLSMWDNNQLLYEWTPNTPGYNSFGLEADGIIGLWNGQAYTFVAGSVYPPDRVVLRDTGFFGAFETTGREWPVLGF